MSNIHIPFSEVVEEVRNCPIELRDFKLENDDSQAGNNLIGGRCVVAFISEKLRNYAVGVDFLAYEKNEEMAVDFCISTEGISEHLFALVGLNDVGNELIKNCSIEQGVIDGQEVQYLDLMSTHCLCIDHAEGLKNKIIAQIQKESLVI